MYETKNKDVYEDSSKGKEMLDFSNYSTKSEYYDDSNKLVVGINRDEAAGVAIKELARLEPKIFLFVR